MGACLCPRSPSAWVLTWLRKGVVKVIPQPVHSPAAGLEGPDQVLLGLGGSGVEGALGGWHTWTLCPQLSVCPSPQAGAQTLGHCSTGPSGKVRREDGFTEVGLRGHWHGPSPGFKPGFELG